MTLRAGLLNGTNINQDYDFGYLLQAITAGGYITGLEVQSGKVVAGKGFMACERTNGNKPFVFIELDADYTIDTTGTKKVWIQIVQGKIDDGSLNAEDGTGIATIQTGANYPSSNYMPLASITGGVITDERVKLQVSADRYVLNSLAFRGLTDVYNFATPTTKKFVFWNVAESKLDVGDVEATDIPPPHSLIDATNMLGVNGVAGQAVYLEQGVRTAMAMTKQNVGDVSGNTRVAFPIYGSGVAGTTFKVNICKTVSPSVDFNFRIETDIAGVPSGTLVNANAVIGIATGSLTTSLAETTLTFPGSVTLTLGVRYWLVCFVGTYGSETVNGTNYYNIGYHSALDTQTRGLLLRGGANRGGGYETSDAHAVAMGSSDAGETRSMGFKITATATKLLYSVTVQSGMNATRCRLFDASFNLLATATIRVGDVFYFGNYMLASGVSYNIQCDSSGSAYTRKYVNGAYGYPVNKTNLNYVGESVDNSNNTANRSNIASIQTGTTTTPASTKRCYFSSTLAIDSLLALTDSDFAYKVDVVGFLEESKGYGTYPRLTMSGINTYQTGLTKDYRYYLSGTSGAITATAGTFPRAVGYALSSTKLFLYETTYNIVPGVIYTAGSQLNDVTKNVTQYTKFKAVSIAKSGKYTVTYSVIYAPDGLHRIYKNGVAFGTEHSAPATFVEDLRFDAGDICEIRGHGGGNNLTIGNLYVQYALGETPYTFLGFNSGTF